MNFNRFSVQIGMRLAVLFIFMLGLALVMANDAPTSLWIILGIAIPLQIWGILKYVNRTNQELVNFITGIRFDDYMQTFTLGHLGQTFRELEGALNLTVSKVKKLRAEREQQAIYFQALVGHMPLPLFFLFPDERLEILNNAMRRAFNVADLTNLDDLTKFGPAFARDVKQIDPGESLLTTITVEDVEQQYIMSATEITMAGRIQKLLSLQNVQSQLDATELATWQNLLRVTSHEILNSLSPVSSLAKTAQGLVIDFENDHPLKAGEKESLQDIRDALDTLVRRSEGLTGFVQSYRQLTRMPPPKLERIDLGKYLKRLESLVQSDYEKKKIRLDISVTPKNLSVQADEGMLDQAMINLLKNAADALEKVKDPKVKISSYFNTRNQVVIEVADNGPGITPEKRDQIFVPFFTTKRQGSGVGLTLVRYVMLSHGGTATYHPNKKKGSIFRLSF